MADFMLSEPATGTLGHRQRIAELEAERDHLLELVTRAHPIITEAAEDYTDWVPAETWLDDTATIVGEAT